MAVYHGTVVLRVQKKSSLALRRADRLGSVGRKQYNIGGARLVEKKISYLLGGQILKISRIGVIKVTPLRERQFSYVRPNNSLVSF